MPDSADGAVVYRQRAEIVDAAALTAGAAGPIPTHSAPADRQRAEIVDATSKLCFASSEGHARKSDMSVDIGNRDDCGEYTRFNKGRLSTRTKNTKSDSDTQVLWICGWPNYDRVVRCGQGNGVPNGLAGCLSSLAVIAVISVHAIDVPDTGEGGGREGKEQGEKQLIHRSSCSPQSLWRSNAPISQPPESSLSGRGMPR